MLAASVMAGSLMATPEFFPVRGLFGDILDTLYCDSEEWVKKVVRNEAEKLEEKSVNEDDVLIKALLVEEECERLLKKKRWERPWERFK
jgi:hypothetical protein